MIDPAAVAVRELRNELRNELAEQKGSVVRYIVERDKKLEGLIRNVRDELVTEIQKVDKRITDPQAWAETTAIRNFKAENFAGIEKRAKRAERGRALATALAVGVTVLSPAIAHLLEALARALEHFLK